MPAVQGKIEDLLICGLLDGLEAVPVIGDVAALIHAALLAAEGRTTEALPVFGNILPVPISLGCLLAYLATGRVPIPEKGPKPRPSTRGLRRP